MNGDWAEKLGILTSIALPLFNVPLIVRLVRRKHSADFSLVWAVGVWACMVLMMPQALRSTDIAFKIFGIMNVLFFSVVAFLIVKYRSKI